MSRGLGTLQRRITDELALQPTKRLPWNELKCRFPQEVEQRTYFQAVRSLRRQSLVYDQRGGTRHYLALTDGAAYPHDLVEATELKLGTVKNALTRLRLVGLLVELISLGRSQQEGRAEVQVTYRFGPPPASDAESDLSMPGLKNGSRS
jgi:hypothetical protein